MQSQMDFNYAKYSSKSLVSVAFSCCLALSTTSSDDDDASVIVVSFAKADDAVNKSFLHLQLEGIHIARLCVRKVIKS
jgi:hypothetical protein